VAPLLRMACRIKSSSISMLVRMMCKIITIVCMAAATGN
jgi:hypothetical protein